jgi:hypothetical protein
MTMLKNKTIVCAVSANQNVPSPHGCSIEGAPTDVSVHPSLALPLDYERTSKEAHRKSLRCKKEVYANQKRFAPHEKCLRCKKKGFRKQKKGSRLVTTVCAARFAQLGLVFFTRIQHFAQGQVFKNLTAGATMNWAHKKGKVTSV